MATDRLVAGLRCSEVLADLSEYIDGGLDPTARARLEAHVQDCDNCDRFGRRFAAVLRTLRAELAAPAPLATSLRSRLRDRLRRERG